MKFELSREPIGAPVSEAVPCSVGARLIFEGLVRDENGGQRVIKLEYESYDVLVLKEGHRLIEEAVEKFSLVDLDIMHRVGVLVPGELAVRVTLTSGHRGEGLDACRWVMDQLKQRIPIWKREHYAQSATWL